VHDPIAAFHQLEDLVERQGVSGPPRDALRALRGRVPTLRGAEPAQWRAFYEEAVTATRELVDRGPDASLSAGERRYVEGLLSDVRDAPSGVSDLWTRRLRDQREELASRAKEEVHQLELAVSAAGGHLEVDLALGELPRWQSWLDEYLDLWTERVTTGAHQDLLRAQEACLERAPEALGQWVRPLPRIAALPPPPSSEANLTTRREQGDLPGSWALFARSARGGLFAAMAAATVIGSLVATFKGAGTTPSRGLFILLLLLPALLWAKVSSGKQRQAAASQQQKKLQDAVRAQLLQATIARIDARGRALSGWLQRQMQAAKGEGLGWSRGLQLRLAEPERGGLSERVTQRVRQLRDELQARAEALAEDATAETGP